MPTSTMPRTGPLISTRLRSLIEQRDILKMPGVFDGLSGRLVERMGFEAAFVSGAGLSESRLGFPDIGLMGLEDSLSGAAMIAARTSLMLIADGDTGYGNAVNVYVTVQRFEQAGLNGLMLEDQVWPKRCGHLAGKEVISADEMVEKVKAAVEARRNPAFIIKARTDAATVLGIDEAIRRATLYARAGADLVFADALVSEVDIRRFASEVEAPVAVNMGLGIRGRDTSPLLSARRLEQIGVAVVIFPRVLTTASVHGMRAAIEELVRGFGREEVLERSDLQVGFDELNDLLGLDELQGIERRHAVT